MLRSGYGVALVRGSPPPCVFTIGPQPVDWKMPFRPHKRTMAHSVRLKPNSKLHTAVPMRPKDEFAG